MKKILILFLGILLFACQKQIVPIKSRSATVLLTDVNIGTTANDGTGDALRTAFQKVNANNALIEAAFATVPTIEEVRTQINGKEASLGNPPVTGYVLSSTTDGTRSWILNGAGGSGSNLNILNVTDYGLVGDGVTDNTVALEALFVSGRTLFFPRGTYLIEKADMVDISDFRFLGEDGTVFTSNGTGTDYQIIQVKGDGAWHDIIFENIKFQGTATQSVEQGEGLITFIGLVDEYLIGDGVTIRNCEFTVPNTNMNGISLLGHTVTDDFKNLLIENCNFHDIGRMGIEAYSEATSGYVGQFNHVVIKNNRFYNIGIISYGQALSTAGSFYLVTENEIYNPVRNQAIEIGHGKYHICTNNQIIGEGIDGFWATSIYYSDNLVYSDNVIVIPQVGTALANMNVEIQNCKNVTVTGNRMMSAGGFVFDGTDNGIVSNNYISSPFQVGIFIRNGSDSLLVSGNRVDMTNTANIGGIIVNGSGVDPQYNVLINNYISAEDGIGYLFEYMEATNNKVVSDIMYSGSLTDGSPTASQINSILGLTPAVGIGSKFTIKDSDGTGLFYQIISDGTSWYYQSSSVAL